MSRVYNFSAGPSAFPESVLQQAQAEMLEWRDSGMSVMEMSHRGKYFSMIAEELEADLRELLTIPANYKVLFLQGGASAQFSLIPQNILNGKAKACYVNTGAWSEKAIQDAKGQCEVILSASAEASKFTHIPDVESWIIEQDAAYLHYTSNETIHGVEFQSIPDSKGLTLVSDMSSNILSRPVDVSQFGLIYAGTQKNMGPAGLTVVIIREDLIGHAMEITPTMFNYQTHSDNGSMFNTPPCYSIYICMLVLDWIKNQIGGLEEMKKINEKKAGMLYHFLDNSKLFRGTVVPKDRSLMNIPFVTGNDEIDAKFVKEVTAADFVNLKGHRSVGGMRASIYNAMPVEGVEKLVAFMTEFEKNNG